MEWEKNTNKILRQNAIDCGLCDQWQREWVSDWPAETMVERFFKGIDFYASTKFVKKEQFKSLFGIKFLRSHNILVDDKWSLLSPKRAALIGSSSSNLRFGMRNVSEVYIFDSSRAVITSKSMSHVIVHLYDSANIEANTFDAGRILVIRHSALASAVVDGNVDVTNEF